MKTSRFSDTQIIAILKQAEAGSPVPELCREHSISTTTFYKWCSKFGVMDSSLMARLKEFEDENRRLKKIYDEDALRPRASPRLWQKSGRAISPPGNGDLGSASLRHIHLLGLPGIQGQRKQLLLPTCANRCKLGDR